MKCVCLILISAAFAGSLSAQSPQDLDRLQAKRRALLAEVEEYPGTAWSRENLANPSLFETRAKQFSNSVWSFSLDTKLSETPGDINPIVAQLLRTRNPIASFVAYRNLVAWIRTRGEEDMDEQYQRDAVRIITAADPYPIEYGLLFQQAYEFAVDKKALKGNAALKYALENYRSPDAWAKMQRALVDSKLDALRTHYSESGHTPVQVEHYAMRDLHNQTVRDLDQPLRQRREKIPEDSSRAKLWTLSQKYVKGAGPRIVEKLASEPDETRTNSLAAYLDFLEFAKGDVEMDKFAANGSAEELLLKAGDPAEAHYLFYREAMAYATDSTFGLGMDLTQAHRFVMELAKRPKPRAALDLHELAMVESLLHSKTREDLAEVANKADKAAGLKVGTTDGFLSGPLSNYWAQNALEKHEAAAQTALAAKTEPTPDPTAVPEPVPVVAKALAHVPTAPKGADLRVPGVIVGSTAAVVGGLYAYSRFRYPSRKCGMAYAQLAPEKNEELSLEQLNARLQDAVSALESEPARPTVPESTAVPMRSNAFEGLDELLQGLAPKPPSNVFPTTEPAPDFALPSEK